MSDGEKPDDEGMSDGEEPDDEDMGQKEPGQQHGKFDVLLPVLLPESMVDDEESDDEGDDEEPEDWRLAGVVLPDGWSLKDDTNIVIAALAEESGYRIGLYTRMLEAGHALRRIRKALPYGEWGPHIAKMGVSESVATKRMRLAVTGLTPQQILALGGQDAALRKHKVYVPSKCAHPEILIAPNGKCCACVQDALPPDEDVVISEYECKGNAYHIFNKCVWRGRDAAFTYKCENCTDTATQSVVRSRRVLLRRAMRLRSAGQTRG